MTETRLWDRAAALPARPDGRRLAEVATLSAGLPTVAELFDFMRDAELRFATLRLRIEERANTARGEDVTLMDAVVRHPGDAKVTTTHPGTGVMADYELWISDGDIVRTYASVHGLGTQRPVRNRPRGLDDPDFPGPSRVYEPVTALPMETLPDTFVHPAGYCQNVLATGRCLVTGTDIVGGREAILVECDHPRTTEVAGDRPDFHISVAVDRDDRRHPAPGRVDRRGHHPPRRSGRAGARCADAAVRLHLRLSQRDDDAVLRLAPFEGPASTRIIGRFPSNASVPKGGSRRRNPSAGTLRRDAADRGRPRPTRHPAQHHRSGGRPQTHAAARSGPDLGRENRSSDRRPAVEARVRECPR